MRIHYGLTNSRHQSSAEGLSIPFFLQALGHTASLPEARENSKQVRADKSRQVVERVAEFLRLHPETPDITRRELVDQLNAAGIRNSKGNAWTKETFRVTHGLAIEDNLVRDELAALPFDDLLPDAAVVAQEDRPLTAEEIEAHYKDNQLWGSF